MFVRVKKNRSDSCSVLVVRKAFGRYIVVKNLGVATNEKAIVIIRVNLPNLGEKNLKTIFTIEKQRMLAPIFHLTDYPQTDSIITLL